MEQIQIKKVWYVALVGRPNSWKSTFINTLIDEKVSIVSSRPQTTQKNIRWIYNDDDSQIIFFDTPWVNEGNEEFFLHLRKKVEESLSDADLILKFIDSSRPGWTEENLISDLADKSKKPVITVFSKTDIKTREAPKDSISISKEERKWFEELLNIIKSKLPAWPLMYPDDYYTDQDYETRISEIVREKVFLNFIEEVPHSVFVEVGEIDETDVLLRIQAYIYCETDSQKHILIWKWWQALTKVGKQAREDLENIFWKKIFLSLRVKTLPKWKKNKKLLNKLF